MCSNKWYSVHSVHHTRRHIMSLVHRHDVVLNTLNIHRSASFWWGRVNRNQCLGVIYARCCWDSCMSYYSVFSMLQCVCLSLYLYCVSFFKHFNFLFIFLPHCLACGILAPWSGIRLLPPAVEGWSLNHWTPGKSWHFVFWLNTKDFFLDTSYSPVCIS